MPPVSTDRRRFLLGAASGALVALAPGARAEEDEADEKKALPRRDFGTTGRQVTVFGLGCFPLGSLRREEAGVTVALRALDAGCTYLDTAPSYSRGRSETRVGLALDAFGRERFEKAGGLLATKTHTRTRDAAWRDLEGSLKRLKVERIDVLQIHAVKDADDLARAFDPERGPIKALLEAREQKLIRWIGITGHWDPKVMRAACEKHDVDAVLLPLNCVDPSYRTKATEGRPAETLSFVEHTLPAAVKKGVARVAMKVFASGRLPKGGVEAAPCLRYTYGLDVSTCIVGCRSNDEVDLAARIAREDRRLTPEETKRLLARAARHRGKSTEWYKRP